MARRYSILLSERVRAAVAAAGAVIAVSITAYLTGPELSLGDNWVISLLGYLITYLAISVIAFWAAPDADVRAWAKGPGRGTFWQRYVWGTAPGPGISIFIAACALAVAMLWLPLGGQTPGRDVRVILSAVLVVVSWVSVVFSFTIAFFADNLVEEEKGLDFPQTAKPEWSDYIYFAVSVMTTFGTTDVTVQSRALRRTVTVNAVIAFVFNTVIVAALVSALPT